MVNSIQGRDFLSPREIPVLLSHLSVQAIHVFRVVGMLVHSHCKRLLYLHCTCKLFTECLMEPTRILVTLLFVLFPSQEETGVVGLIISTYLKAWPFSVFWQSRLSLQMCLSSFGKPCGNFPRTEIVLLAGAMFAHKDAPHWKTFLKPPADLTSFKWRGMPYLKLAS